MLSLPSVSELSIRLASPLTTPTLVPPTGSVETAQPIRTMAIIIEGGAREERGRGGEGLGEEGENDEEGVEEVEEAEEQEEVIDTTTPNWFLWSDRSSSWTDWSHWFLSSCARGPTWCPAAPGAAAARSLPVTVSMETSRAPGATAPPWGRASCSRSWW